MELTKEDKMRILELAISFARDNETDYKELYKDIIKLLSQND